MSHNEFKTDVFHEVDHQACRRKLDNLYGLVARDQDLSILRAIESPGGRVLDVGAGYGTLTATLEEHGFEAVGIEPNQDKVELAREWYSLELQDEDIYQTSFPDNHFDCVILREVVFHLDFERAMQEIWRICKNQVIVFQGNSVGWRSLAARMYGHREFNERDRAFYVSKLREAGYELAAVQYRDAFAFPLSGGFIGKQFVLPLRWCYRLTMGIDKLTTALLRAIRMDRFVCMRFMVSGTKPK